RTTVTSNQEAEIHDFYDAASNVTSESRNSGTRTMTYDAMNRLLTRVSPKEDYGTNNCINFQPYGVQGGVCGFNFPLSTGGTSDLVIAGDTAVFAYDAAGRMIQADNNAARIRRTYTPGGLLATDTSRVRVYAATGTTVPSTEFTTHVYGLNYSYNVDGMRTGLTHPDAIDPCSGACSAEADAYDVGSGTNETGRLTSVTAVLGHTISFSYTDDGQLNDIAYPGSIHTHSTFDAEGRPVTHTVGTTGTTGLILSDSLTYDPAGRITTG